MKNKKKSTHLAIISVLLAALVVCFSACTKDETPDPSAPHLTKAAAEEESEIPEIETEEVPEFITEEETTEEETTEEADDYMAAYNEFLKSYNGGEYGPNARFELIYFNDDDIPELIVADDNYHACGASIMKYTDGKVVKIYEGGAWGSLIYVERQSIVSEGYVSTGVVTGSVVKVNDDGTEEVMFEFEDNAGFYPPGSDEISFMINGEEVSEEEYNKAIDENMPENTKTFEEGVPLTIDNIDKYCK